MADKIHPIRLYLIVYVILLCLLALTISAAYIDFGRHPSNAIAIGIGCIKAILIILFFMHIKDQRWINWFFAAAGFVWLGIMITLMMTDYLTRNHPAHSSPKGEPVFISWPWPDPGSESTATTPMMSDVQP